MILLILCFYSRLKGLPERDNCCIPVASSILKVWYLLNSMTKNSIKIIVQNLAFKYSTTIWSWGTKNHIVVWIGKDSRYRVSLVFLLLCSEMWCSSLLPLLSAPKIHNLSPKGDILKDLHLDVSASSFPLFSDLEFSSNIIPGSGVLPYYSFHFLYFCCFHLCL